MDWFEIISENYMENEGKAKRMLERIAEHYPIVMHGVSLSIGSTDPLNMDYLSKLKTLMTWVKPAWISDHVCFTGVAQKNTHDLLPMPYTQEALSHIVSRIKKVQDILECKIAFENPSTYLEFTSSSMPEAEFIARMVDEADCNLLLDVNNVYVSCYNHHLDTKAYLDALPLDKVIQIHISGHSNHDTHIIDTHDDSVIDDVWTLYRYVIHKAARIPNTMVEWDANIPKFSVLYAELEKARNMTPYSEVNAPLANFEAKAEIRNQTTEQPTLHDVQSYLQASILSGYETLTEQESWIRLKPHVSLQEQIHIYAVGYRMRLYDAVREDYPVLALYWGEKRVDALLKAFVNQVQSRHFNLANYSYHLPDFLKAYDDADEIAIGLATLESAIAQMSVAPESIALERHHLAHIAPDALMQMQFMPRKALSILAFSCNINAVYSAVLAQKSYDNIRRIPSFLAVYRHDNEVWRLPLDSIEYYLLQIVFSGVCLNEAIEMVQSKFVSSNHKSIEKFNANLVRWVSSWLENGLFIYAE